MIQTSPFVRIVASVGLTTVIVTALVLVLIPAQAWVLGPIIGSLSLMAIFLGHYASKHR